MVDRKIHVDKRFPTLLQIEANKPVVLSARQGMSVACLSGELWVTHEGDLCDYVLPKGYRYCCGKSGLIVISSLGGMSNALAYWTNPASCPNFNRNSVSIDPDSTTRLVQEAHRQRNLAIGDLICSLGRTLCRVVQSIATRIRVGGTFLRQRNSNVSIDETALNTALTKIRQEYYDAKTHL